MSEFASRERIREAMRRRPNEVVDAIETLPQGSVDIISTALWPMPISSDDKRKALQEMRKYLLQEGLHESDAVIQRIDSDPVMTER